MPTEIKLLKERVSIFKDVAMFTGGMVGIGFQQYLSSKGTPPNFIFLGIFTLMTGIPGATRFIGLFRSQSHTELPSSSSVPPDSHTGSEQS